MKNRISRIVVLLLVAVLLVPTVLTGCKKKEADFPGSSPITIIVPWSAGGSVDMVARVIAPRLTDKLGTVVNVENQAGGQSIPGTVEVLQSTPDGHTLLSDADGSNCVPEAWGSDVPFKVEERTYICRITILPMVFAVAQDTGWTSIDDVAEAIKNNPEDVKFGWLGGTGGIDCPTAQFLAELNARGIDTSKINMVTFPGGSDLATAVAGGHVDIGSCSPTSVKSAFDAGLVDIISITSAERFPKHPDVATTREQGWDAVNYVGHVGLSGPVGMSDDVVKTISDLVAEIVKMDDVIAELEGLGLLVEYLGPDAYKANVLELAEILKKVKVA